MSRFLSLAALALLVGSAVSSTAQATTITQSYNFAIDFTASSAVPLWTGSVSLTYDPMQSNSVTASSFTSNLGAEYGQWTVTDIYRPAYVGVFDYIPAEWTVQIADAGGGSSTGTNTGYFDFNYYEAPTATSIPDSVGAVLESSLNTRGSNVSSSSITLQSAATTSSSVPEPTGLAVLGLGAVVLGSLSARRRPA